jgi:hypothetical protein
MSQSSWLLLWLFLGGYFAVTATLALSGTSRLDFLQSFGHSADIIIPVHIRALRQSTSILTQVFLGFAIQDFFPETPVPGELTTISQVITFLLTAFLKLFGVIAYIFLWFFTQRSLGVYVECLIMSSSREVKEFAIRRKVVTHLVFGIMAVISFYFTRFALTLLNLSFFMIGVVFAADLFFHFVLIGHLWARSQREGTLRHRQGHRENERL